MTSDSESNDDQLHDSSDSDSQLQQAFTQGKLKPGYNIPEIVQKRESINNVSALRQKLDDFKMDLDWIEKLDMTNDLAPVTPEIASQLGQSETANEDDIHDDFKREITFYRQAQAAVLYAIPRLQKLGILTKRPKDYFAEMAKSEEHMQKVRQKLLTKQAALERSSKAKKLRELRKQGKKIHHDVLQQRHKDKKEMLEAVKRYRKGDKNGLDFLNDKKKSGSHPAKKKNNPQAMAKKNFKDSKYGYGGKKKRSKYNTATSSADMTKFSSRNNSKSNRPGKLRRQNTKSKRKSKS